MIWAGKMQQHSMPPRQTATVPSSHGGLRAEIGQKPISALGLRGFQKPSPYPHKSPDSLHEFPESRLRHGDNNLSVRPAKFHGDGFTAVCDRQKLLHGHVHLFTCFVKTDQRGLDTHRADRPRAALGEAQRVRLWSASCRQNGEAPPLRREKSKDNFALALTKLSVENSGLSPRCYGRRKLPLNSLQSLTRTRERPRVGSPENLSRQPSSSRQSLSK